MPLPALNVVIATCQRSVLLDRMLGSLAACELPPNLERVLVVENGPQLGAQTIVERFRGQLPMVYHHVPEPSKSPALNEAVDLCGDSFVIFFDDDVRVHPGTLTAYAREVEGRAQGLFIGGRCLVDYDEPPPSWLHNYLPLSAKGWSNGNGDPALTQPDALGFNWGAFASDIRAAGGFDENFGPGRAVSIGEERELQESLLQQGVTGRYVADAVAWHFVPRERCNPEWTLRRTQLMGISAGRKLATRASRLRRLTHEIGSRVRLAAFDAVLATCAHRLSTERKFHFEQRRHWRKGFREGLHVRPS